MESPGLFVINFGYVEHFVDIFVFAGYSPSEGPPGRASINTAEKAALYSSTVGNPI